MNTGIDYCSIFRAVPDLYLILSRNYSIVDASDAYLKATMVERNNILGKDIFKAFPDNPDDPNPESITNLQNSLNIVLQEKSANAMNIQKYDIRKPQKEGGAFEERYWKPLNKPVIDENNQVKYIIHRVEDVTELEHVKESELKKKMHIQMLMENIKEYAIVMTNEKGLIMGWNVGAQEIFGYNANEILGKSFSCIYPKNCFATNHPEQILQLAATNGHIDEDAWRMRKNGSRFWARSVLTTIHDNKNLIGYCEIIQDITVENNLETLKNEIISIVNHELRTPLSAIFGSIKLILGGAVSNSQEKNKQLLEIAGSNCDHLMKLINDILDIDKITSGKMKFNLQLHDLSDIIKEAIALNKVYADSYKIVLVNRTIIKGLNVKIDATRMIQVLTNLITNAVKFSAVGEEVIICTSTDKDKVRVSVINKGPGVPKDFKKKIFDRFSRADLSTNRDTSGAGLGLAISKAILNGLGSKLKYKSVPHNETIFYFDLPLLINKES